MKNQKIYVISCSFVMLHCNAKPRIWEECDLMVWNPELVFVLAWISFCKKIYWRDRTEETERNLPSSISLLECPQQNQLPLRVSNGGWRTDIWANIWCLPEHHKWRLNSLCFREINAIPLIFVWMMIKALDMLNCHWEESVEKRSS